MIVMKIQFKKGLYITHSRERWLLDETNDDIRDAFCFENAREISKEKYKIFMDEVKK